MELSNILIQKIPVEQSNYDKKLVVLFIDKETNTMKIARPHYHGLDAYFKKNVSQVEALLDSEYRSSFVDVTKDFNWPQVTKNIFHIIYDVNTREVLQMKQLIDYNYDCMNYFYENLDPKGWFYTKKR